MCADESPYAESPGEEGPPLEDGYKADDTASTAQEQWHPVEEDDPSLLDRGSRALKGPVAEGVGDSGLQDLSRLSPSAADAEVVSDITAGLPESAAATTAVHPEQTGDWENELSAHRVAVELRRIESDV